MKQSKKMCQNFKSTPTGTKRHAAARWDMFAFHFGPVCSAPAPGHGRAFTQGIIGDASRLLMTNEQGARLDVPFGRAWAPRRPGRAGPSSRESTIFRLFIITIDEY
jgi:hypothetical protein